MEGSSTARGPHDLVLRDVVSDDLPVFFEHQRDPEANRMAAFTVKNPADHAAFTTRWSRILNDETIRVMTIVADNEVAGYVSTYEEAGEREVTYWIGKPFWGQGIATRALAAFLTHAPTRPLHARAAKDNIGSIRVLQKCGFVIVGEDHGFANARGEDTEEYLLELSRNEHDNGPGS